MSNYQTNNFHCHFAKPPCLQIFNSTRRKILDLTQEKKTMARKCAIDCYHVIGYLYIFPTDVDIKGNHRSKSQTALFFSLQHDVKLS